MCGYTCVCMYVCVCVCVCVLMCVCVSGKIKEQVLQRAVDGLRKERRPFVGVLYAGLMITKASKDV